jgi:hypothetical protein
MLEKTESRHDAPQAETGMTRANGHAYGWVVVGAGALMTCVAMGSMFSLAVFLQPMSVDTGWSRTGISTAMTIDFLTMGVAAFGWGALTDRFGPRLVGQRICQCVGAHIKHLRPVLKRAERGSNIFSAADFEHVNINAKLAGYSPNLGHLSDRAGIADIGNDRHSAEVGENLTQELDSFAGKFGRLCRQTGDVATRPGQRGNQIGANGVDRYCKHDWDCRGCLHCGSNRTADRNDDIHFESNELPCNFAKTFGAPLCPAIFDRDRTPLDPAKLAQPLNKGACPFAPC